jgi:hypothetical protein
LDKLLQFISTPLLCSFGQGPNGSTCAGDRDTSAGDLAYSKWIDNFASDTLAELFETNDDGRPGVNRIHGAMFIKLTSGPQQPVEVVAANRSPAAEWRLD